MARTTGNTITYFTWWPGTDKIVWNNFGRTQCAPSGAGYMDIA